MKRKILTSIPIISTITTTTILSITSCAYNSFLLEDFTNNVVEAGFDENKLNLIDKYVTFRLDEVIAATESKAYGFPSMQICVTKDSKIVYNKAFGKSYLYSQGDETSDAWPVPNYGKLLPANEQVTATTETLYDLASNTKMYAGMFAIQKLLFEKKIHSLDDPISKYIPSFTKEQPDVWNDLTKKTETVQWNTITIRDILTHVSGFIPSPTIFLTGGDNPTKWLLRDKSEALDKILMLDLQTVPGTKQVYSDVDFMLVDILIHEITNKWIDEYTEQEIYKPLGLKHTVFNPLQKGFSKDDCVATELIGNTRELQVSFLDIRTKTIRGETHDEKAFYCMNGASGHAGLFSTASDLSVLMNMMLNNGKYGNQMFFDENIVREVTTPIVNPQGTEFEFATGWKTNYSFDNTYIFGNYAPNLTYGHDGWTGTMTVIDPVNHLTICILTNSIHTPLYNHDSNGSLFFGKHRYFLPEGTASSLNRIGMVVSNWVYEACNTLKK